MREAFVSISPSDELQVEIRDVTIPKPGVGQVVIRVVAAGLNPKDWVYATSEPFNQGDDIAGYIHAVGDQVLDFKPGDRVAAFHKVGAPHGGFAEYAVAFAHTTFHIPHSTSFEEAATIPLAAMTSCLALFYDLRLPSPITPAREPTPLIIYGGSSTVGTFAIKLASLANIHPILTVAGGGAPSIQHLLDPSKGDAIIDYRKGNDAVVSGLRAALKGAKATVAFDAVSRKETIHSLAQVLEPHVSTMSLVLVDTKTDDPITQIISYVGAVHFDHNPLEKDVPRTGRLGEREFATVFYKLFTKGLEEGWFSGHPHHIVEGGLLGIPAALEELRSRRVSSFKYVVRIADTPGLGSTE